MMKGKPMDKLILNLAPTGMIPTKEMTEHVPVTANEIIDCVVECSRHGVSMVHIHARDEYGKPTYKRDTYASIIYGIRERNPEMVIVASTSGRNFCEFSQRSEVLELKGDLKPDMASLTLGSMNFINQESVNSPDMIKRLAHKMIDKGIKPELEIFDLGMLNYCKYLIGKGLLEEPYFFNIFMGSICSLQPSYSHLGAVIADLPKGSLCCHAGIGRSQKFAAVTGVISGNAVRIGLEDNIWIDEEKKTKASNIELVKRVVHMAEIYGREAASPEETRILLGLQQTKL